MHSHLKHFPKTRFGQASLANRPTIDIPFQRVAIDIVEPIKPASKKGNPYVLALIDMATIYNVAVVLKAIDTVRVAGVLLAMFSRHGAPKEISSDRGANFTLELIKGINRLISLKQLPTTPYHPLQLAW